MNLEQGDRLAPELLQLVVIPLEGRQNMDNNVAKIDEQPPRVYRPLVVVGQDALFF